MSLPFSKSRIDRAGQALRAHQSGDAPLTYDELVEKLSIVEAFRKAHTAPLTRVAANLRYYVSEASGGSFVVGQRLKRMATIRDKLDREPSTSLSRMHDLGGCRAVLGDQAAVDQVLARLREQRRWELLLRTWDYVSQPKPDGYRTKHVVARKGSPVRVRPAGSRKAAAYGGSVAFVGLGHRSHPSLVSIGSPRLSKVTQTAPSLMVIPWGR